MTYSNQSASKSSAEEAQKTAQEQQQRGAVGTLAQRNISFSAWSAQTARKLTDGSYVAFFTRLSTEHGKLAEELAREIEIRLESSESRPSEAAVLASNKTSPSFLEKLFQPKVNQVLEQAKRAEEELIALYEQAKGLVQKSATRSLLDQHQHQINSALNEIKMLQSTSRL